MKIISFYGWFQNKKKLDAKSQKIFGVDDHNNTKINFSVTTSIWEPQKNIKIELNIKVFGLKNRIIKIYQLS